MSKFQQIPDELHPDLVEFLEYWWAKRAGNRIPTRSAVDPADIHHLLSGICLLELLYHDETLERVRFKLAGTEIYRMAGRELTGHYVDDVAPAELYGEIEAQFLWMIKAMEPTYRRFRWPNPARSEFVYERVLAPLGEPDMKPSHFIGMHVTTCPGYYRDPGLEFPVA